MAKRSGSGSKKPQSQAYAASLARLRKGEHLTKEEAKKRDDLLERNKAAAQRCRKRKKEQQQNLEEESQRLCDANAELTCMVESLRDEVSQLRSAVLGHQQAANACHAGGLGSEATEILSRPLVELKRTAPPGFNLPDEVVFSQASKHINHESPMESSSSSLSRNSSFMPVEQPFASPPILTPPPFTRPADGASYPARTEVPQPSVVDPALGGVGGASSPGFPFYDIAVPNSVTPGGQNVDLSAFLS